MAALAPAGKPFNICYMGAIFADVAELLRHGLASLGHEVHVGPANIGVDCRNVILGAHLIQDFSLLPDDSIIFNLEQLGSASVLLKPAYLACLRRHHVWDYSPRNIAWLEKNGIDAALVRLGHAPALARVPQVEVQDIDVLFYGAVNERRQAVLDGLRAAGLHVVALTGGVVLTDLDAYIARSKVVLNVHYYETKIFEIVRVSYLLNNRKAVVSEIDEGTEIEDELRAALLGVAYDGLVDACRALVADAPRRHRLEQEGGAIFAARSQAAFMRQAVERAARFAGGPSAAAAVLPRRINLARRGNVRDGFLNIAAHADLRVDLHADLGRPGVLDDTHDSARYGRVQLPRDYFETIVAHDVLQRVHDLPTLMRHCLDLLDVGGILDVSVPYDLSHGAWQDPTHVRAFNERSWLVYTEWFWQLGWQDARFEQAELHVQFSQYGQQLQAAGMALEEIMRLPRAIDVMSVKLRKRLLDDADKAAAQRFLQG